ncbi:MAG: S41 family peptidase [Myxococcota bacterium]
MVGDSGSGEDAARDSGYGKSAMIFRIQLVCALLVSGCATTSEPPPQAKGPEGVFEDVWGAMQAELYDKARSESWLTRTNYLDLKAKARQVGDVGALARDVINPFLKRLEVSHTYLYTDDELGFYVLRCLFTHEQSDEPKLHHIGVQLTDENFVRAVWEDFPGDQSGLQRGDKIVAIDGEAFVSVKQFGPKAQVLEVRRGRTSLMVQVSPVFGNPIMDMLQAMQNSVAIEERDGRRVGYVHLWTGLGEETLATFARIVREQLFDLDAVVVDLRGGFGGAWYEYLDLFYADRSQFFAFALIERDGTRVGQQPTPQKNPDAFLGPVVVLIDEGTRSGKEALAYQFAKGDRAILVGQRTQGAFTLGKGVFAKRLAARYLLYLAVNEVLLDGNVIEGVGVGPDIEIEFPADRPSHGDPQLETAMNEAFAAIANPRAYWPADEGTRPRSVRGRSAQSGTRSEGRSSDLRPHRGVERSGRWFDASSSATGAELQKSCRRYNLDEPSGLCGSSLWTQVKDT